jgi:hypothetical protein
MLVYAGIINKAGVRKMAKKKKWMGMLAITLVFGMAAFSACTSTAYAKLDEPEMPDAQTAVVYFIATNSRAGVVWDGETPVGDFGESGDSAMVWRTTPGSHYFIYKGFNFIVMRADLDPNKRYYVHVMTIPNPIPFSRDMLSARVLTPDEGEKWFKVTTIVSFTDQWREEFLQKEKDALKEVQEQLREAKGKSMPVDMKKSDGRR